MSTNALVRAAWLSKVMSHASILAITPKIYDHDLTEESTKEQSKLFHNTIVNAISYLVTSSLELRLRGNDTRNFVVDVTYIKQYDVDGANWKAVSDFFSTIENLVRTELGGTWNSTVDYYQNQSAPPSISLGTIGGRRCWIGKYRFIATKGL